MSQVLFNPTNEYISGFFAGIEIKLEPGKKLKVPDNCANHMINSHGPKGLVSLTWGDDEEQKGKEGIARNLEFKQKQIARYNYMNEQRRAKGLEWIVPTKEVKAYADELKIKLMQPWSLQIDDQAGAKTEMKAMKAENASLKETLSEMAKTLAALQAQMNSGTDQKKGGAKAKEA